MNKKYIDKLNKDSKDLSFEDDSIQLTLFSHFITNNESEVSNAIEIWDSIPKYFLTNDQIQKARNKNGSQEPYEWHYVDNHNVPCCVVIHPALIKMKDKEGIEKYQICFPSTTEEIIEEILRKFLTDRRRFGKHDADERSTWVRFTLTMIFNELKKRKHSRNFDEIKHAIQVMSSSTIEVHRDGKEIWRGTILQDLITVGRKEYLEDAAAYHVAKFPIFISQSINNLEYRQINYNRLMSFKKPITRWIYRKLVNRFKQAGYGNSYHFKYSDLKTSGLLQKTNESKNRKSVTDALEELTKLGVISIYKASKKMEGKTIKDIIYEISAGRELVGDQKASNKRDSDNQISVSQHKYLTTS